MIHANDDDNQTRRLDDEQKIDARQLIGCGRAIPDVARHCGLSETELRREIDLPQWQSEPDRERQQTRFDMGGK
jgi:hypothetical protein